MGLAQLGDIDIIGLLFRLAWISLEKEVGRPDEDRRGSWLRAERLGRGRKRKRKRKSDDWTTRVSVGDVEAWKNSYLTTLELVRGEGQA